MPSLLDAIEAKYGQDGSDCEAPIGIYVPRVGPRKSIPRLLVLNDCGVDSAGDEESLKKTCAGVIEIDIAHNRLTSWNEISKILQYSPSVSFLNLSFNGLSSPLLTSNNSTCVSNLLNSSSAPSCFRFPILPRLSVLILIGTNVSWDAVWFILRHATTLQELHLSLNNFSGVDTSKMKASNLYMRMRGSRNDSGNHGHEEDGERSKDVPSLIHDLPQGRQGRISESTDSGHSSSSGSSDEDEGACFPYLRRLMLDGNPISCWDEVMKLGSCFPSLRHLGLADCQISSIPEKAYHNFENLHSLTLSNTLINNMTDLERLRKFRALTDLRLQGIPLFTEMTAHERRQLLVALLPNIKKLNGGAPITLTEREDAERAFIRRFVQEETPHKPERYYELVSIHGELQPLLDLKLKPATRIKIRICTPDNSFERQVNVYQTTTELKLSLEQVVGLTPSKMKLFYVDGDLREVVGREEMRFPQKQLYSYNMQEGDEIHVEPKMSPVQILKQQEQSSNNHNGSTNSDSSVSRDSPMSSSI